MVSRLEPIQIQISRSIPDSRISFGSSVEVARILPGESYPFTYTVYGPTYFIDAPNVSHNWNIKNASQIIRNIETELVTEAEPEGEIEYSIEYQIRSSGVPILIALEHRTLFYKAGSLGVTREQRQETTFNYEAVRSQYVIPGSGVEIATNFRNYKQISGVPMTIGFFQVLLRNIELNLSVERV